MANMAVVSQNEIELACDAVTDVDINGSGPVIYFYSIVLDGKPCIKAGKTVKKLVERITQYLNKEHLNQNKMPGTLNVLGIIIMEEDTITTCETFIKSALKNYPLNPRQNHNTEQYDLCKGWIQVRDHIANFPFALESFLNPNAELVIAKLYKMCCMNYRVLASNFIKEKCAKKTRERKMLAYINKMTSADFTKINGIGKVSSLSIYDKLPLSSVYRLNNISGISTNKFNNIYKYVESMC